MFSAFFSGETSVSVSLPLFRMASFLEAAALLLAGSKESLELASFRSSGGGGFSSFVTDGSDSPNNVFTITSLFLCPSLSRTNFFLLMFFCFSSTFASISVFSSFELLLISFVSTSEDCESDLLCITSAAFSNLEGFLLPDSQSELGRSLSEYCSVGFAMSTRGLSLTSCLP